MSGETFTQEELLEEMKKRFGEDRSNWAFICPNCDDVAVSADFAPFTESGYGSDLIGQICIGRKLGALKAKSNKEWKQSGGRGCDWTANGLFRGPWSVITPEGRQVYCFALAPATI